MSTLIKLFTTLILAGVVLLILAASGLVRFTPENTTQVDRNHQPEQKQTTQAGPDYSTLQVSALTLEPGGGMETADVAETWSGMHGAEQPDHDAPFEAAREFILTWDEEQSAQDLETALRKHLLSLGISSEQVEQAAGMCFWKGFVTLQQVKAKQDMKDRFELELELKQAGFAAQGLMLDQEIIAFARQRFEEMEDNHAAGEKL
jgi:hypothetical protein